MERAATPIRHVGRTGVLVTTTMESIYERVVRARNPDRLFPVRSNERYGFYAGRLVDDSAQALIGLRDDRSMLLLTFTNNGWLYDIARVNLPQFAVPPEDKHLWVNEQEFHEFLFREYSFEPALVRVNRFLVSDDECGFWVGPLPWHFEQFLADPKEYSPEEQREYQQLIIDFIDRDAAVLDWGNEWYVLDIDGRATK